MFLVLHICPYRQLFATETLIQKVVWLKKWISDKIQTDGQTDTFCCHIAKAEDNNT